MNQAPVTFAVGVAGLQLSVYATNPPLESQYLELLYLDLLMRR